MPLTSPFYRYHFFFVHVRTPNATDTKTIGIAARQIHTCLARTKTVHLRPISVAIRSAVLDWLGPITVKSTNIWTRCYSTVSQPTQILGETAQGKRRVLRKLAETAPHFRRRGRSIWISKDIQVSQYLVYLENQVKIYL